jgi:rhamnosyl/mannosyltransferase
VADFLVLGKYYYPFQGGVEDNCRYICEALAKSHKTTLVAFAHDDRHGAESINGVRVVRCPTQAVVKSQPISLGVIRHTLFAKADVIHFHAPNVWSSLFLLARMKWSRCPGQLVITHHMDMYGRPLLRWVARQLYDRLVRRAAFVIVTSEKNARISDDLREPCEIRAMPLGIEPELYETTDNVRARARQLREQIGGAPLVAFVGRHARYKGLDVLLRALARMDDVHAILGGDGPYRAQMEALATELGLADRVRFVGRVSHEEKLAILVAADLFAFPSTEITEAFGVSQLEAMVMGTPVVASDLPTGVTDVAVDGVTAMLAPPADDAALAATIQRVLNDRPLAQSLAAEAQRRVHAIYNNELVARRATVAMEELVLAGKARA